MVGGAAAGVVSPCLNAKSFIAEEESIMADAPTPAPPRVQHLQRDASATIAYHRTAGKSPGVVFLTGYKSDMTGQKAVRLEEFCRARGQAFVRFDYYGHGQSSGMFTDGTIGRWAEDTVSVLDHLTEGPQVLVGSSLGGWIMILAALQRRERIVGLVGTAAAPDFTEDIPAMLNDDQKAALERDGVVPVYSPYDPEPTPVTRLILEDGRRHLVMGSEIPLDCPVRLIHGMEDPDVPWQTSWQLASNFRSRDVEITLVKAGDHRLSEPEDLERLCRTLEVLLSRP
jgi:pimeloyl-ACP methyl ester carboxylesterase